MTPPDSDAREVCGAGVSDRWPRYETFTCELPKGHGGFHLQGDTTWSDENTAQVSRPLSLAQRILAALENAAELYVGPLTSRDLRALAAELRERLPK